MYQVHVEAITRASWRNGSRYPKPGRARGLTRNAPAIPFRISGLGATFDSRGEVRNFAIGWTVSW